MAFETCKRSYMIQKHISKPTGSTLSKLLLPFRGSNKLADTKTPPLWLFNVSAMVPRPLNILATAPIGSKALPKVYSYAKMQDIIQIMIEAKLAAIKNLHKRFLQARFLDVY